MQLPYLAPVPPAHHDLTIKTTSSGITFLKQNRFRSRYTGNKSSAVDINGNLWLKASELKKEIAGGEKKRIKKPSVETPGLSNSFINAQQMSENLSTQPGELQTDLHDLSTKKERVKEYTVYKREVRQRLLGFINSQSGKKELYFWTVTFPKGTSDAIAYKIYNNWLTQLRQYKMLKNYLWVAERQQIGTVHFHIAIPHKMPVQRANAMMRGILKTFSKRGDIDYSTYQCNRYNGVDIAKNRSTGRVTNFAIKKGSRSLVVYLTKYVTKNDTAFTHLAWHNSRGYSSIFTGVTFTVPEFKSYGFQYLLDKAKQLSSEYFVFIPWLGDPPALITDHLYKLNSYLQTVLT